MHSTNTAIASKGKNLNRLGHMATNDGQKVEMVIIISFTRQTNGQRMNLMQNWNLFPPRGIQGGIDHLLSLQQQQTYWTEFSLPQWKPNRLD